MLARETTYGWQRGTGEPVGHVGGVRESQSRNRAWPADLENVAPSVCLRSRRYHVVLAIYLESDRIPQPEINRCFSDLEFRYHSGVYTEVVSFERATFGQPPKFVACVMSPAHHPYGGKSDRRASLGEQRHTARRTTITGIAHGDIHALHDFGRGATCGSVAHACPYLGTRSGA